MHLKKIIDKKQKKQNNTKPPKKPSPYLAKKQNYKIGSTWAVLSFFLAEFLCICKYMYNENYRKSTYITTNKVTEFYIIYAQLPICVHVHVSIHVVSSSQYQNTFIYFSSIKVEISPITNDIKKQHIYSLHSKISIQLI